MSDELKSNLAEIVGWTMETWKGIAIAAGHSSGLFDILKQDSSISISDLAKRKDFDFDKIKNWVFFADRIGIVNLENGGVKLTPKGALLCSGSPHKDILAFVEGTTYFIKAASSAETTFKKNQSLDKLSDGKISKDYQPKVSDNLSVALIEHIKKQKISDGDSLLDVGCGNGNFLRELYRAIPSINYSGVDLNLFAIEKGKKENISLGLSNNIKMLVGDILEDLEDFPDNSVDWVTTINIMHFIPENKRESLIHNIIRIARKGVFFNLVESETSLIGLAGNSLMHLLWNDFTGFYTNEGTGLFFTELPKKYPNCEIKTASILHGNSQLVTMLKK